MSTYPYAVVPNSCTTCTISNGQSVNYPVAYMAIYEGSNRLTYVYYLDQAHTPILMTNGAFTAGTNLHIVVKYEWCGSPGDQYTAKVYSKMPA